MLPIIHPPRATKGKTEDLIPLQLPIMWVFASHSGNLQTQHLNRIYSVLQNYYPLTPYEIPANLAFKKP